VLSMTFFPSWLARLEAQLQLGRIEMVSDSFQSCEEHMLQRRQHFLLCHGHPSVVTRLEDSRFEWARVAEDRLLPVAAPGASAGPLWRIDARASTPVPVLAYSQESGLGQIVRAALPAAFDARRFTPVFTSHHAVLLKTMALEGRGIAWLPRSLIEAELTGGRLCPVDEGDWQLPIDIRLYRERAPLPEAAEALWALVRGARP
jgi:LysR family transcriptional regulator, hypochlorite-specific transcription factor HypT